MTSPWLSCGHQGWAWSPPKPSAQGGQVETFSGKATTGAAASAVVVSEGLTGKSEALAGKSATLAGKFAPLAGKAGASKIWAGHQCEAKVSTPAPT